MSGILHDKAEVAPFRESDGRLDLLCRFGQDGVYRDAALVAGLVYI